jgi:hypothetical protein
MLLSLLLTSSILVTTGGVGSHARGGGAASADSDSLASPRVGISSREEVVHMWGKPATEKVEKDNVICTWPFGRKTVTLTFNTRLDLLVDRKVLKN